MLSTLNNCTLTRQLGVLSGGGAYWRHAEQLHADRQLGCDTAAGLYWGAR